MHHRAEFWSPVPDGSQIVLRGERVIVTPVPVAAAYWLSGGATAFGPRDVVAGDAYALRIAPDRVLFVGQSLLLEDVGEVGAITEFSDGLVMLDIEGEGAAELMAQGGEYPFESAPGLPTESATLRFAGFRVIVSRRPQGWRLHIERPWATALWHWLQAHVD